MNISVVGMGYVGTVLGIGLAKLGHNVTLVDIDEEKLNKVKEGKAPIYEKGLQEMLDEGKDLRDWGVPVLYGFYHRHCCLNRVTELMSISSSLEMWCLASIPLGCPPLEVMNPIL